MVTRGAVAALPGEDVTDLAGAAVWGLVRSRSRRTRAGSCWPTCPPGRRRHQAIAAQLTTLLAALESGEPELAVRDGQAYAPRLARPAAGAGRPRPGPWRLDVTGRGHWTAWRSCLSPRRPRRWRPGRSGSRSAPPG